MENLLSQSEVEQFCEMQESAENVAAMNKAQIENKMIILAGEISKLRRLAVQQKIESGLCQSRIEGYKKNISIKSGLLKALAVAYYDAPEV